VVLTEALAIHSSIYTWEKVPGQELEFILTGMQETMICETKNVTFSYSLKFQFLIITLEIKDLSI